MRLGGGGDSRDNKYNILDREPEEKIPDGRTSHKWQDNIRMDFKEVRYENVNWIFLNQYRV
jgi:hypothetical protein